MSTNLIPRLRGRGKHDPDAVIGRLSRDNEALTKRAAAADEFFGALMRDVFAANQAWQNEVQRRELAERAVAQLEAVVALRDREIADLKRKVDVGVKAEHVIAKTQEIDVDDLRKRFAAGPVRTLHAAADDGLLSPAIRISASGASADPTTPNGPALKEAS